ncbi:hypothetical protein APHAL10511_003256 [Amanita phalloides]|nr:hypothetical protein APHAL10511_003256 [Amanita phalloides]
MPCLPPELWARIFSFIPRPSHLLAVSLVSRSFSALAAPALARHLIYTDPRFFLAHVPTNPAHFLLSTSLVLAISYMNDGLFSRHDPSIALVHLDGNISYARGLDPADAPTPSLFLASPAFYARIARQVAQFSMLTELIFHNAHLPPLVYQLLASFPHLEHLFFYDCFMPVVKPQILGLEGLQNTENSQEDPLPTAPITKLALWNMRNEPDHIPHSFSSIRHALRLIAIPTLRTLHVDWTRDSSLAIIAMARQGAVPPVSELSVRMPAQYAWPADLTTARTRLLDPLAAFLGRLPSVTRLSVSNRLPFCAITPDALPLLEAYSGPHTSVMDFANYRNLVHVEFKDEDKKTLNVISVLPDLKRVAPRLETLSLPLRKWTEEIMYPTSDFFPRLKKLKIVYDEDFPTEYTILSLGARFLHKLKYLHTFQLYNPLYSTRHPPPPVDLTAVSPVYPYDLLPSAKSFSPSSTSTAGKGRNVLSGNGGGGGGGNLAHRAHFIAAYTDQPSSTVFEELAFPPSQTLYVSHRLTKMPAPPESQSSDHGAHHGHRGRGSHHGPHQDAESPRRHSHHEGQDKNADEDPLERDLSGLGAQAGQAVHVTGYLAAWQKHCKALRRVQFISDYMWRRLDDELSWEGERVKPENAIRFVD